MTRRSRTPKLPPQPKQTWEGGGKCLIKHGLGQYKRDEILRYKSPLEMELMCRIKAELDPQGIMNPGNAL
jgi:FAD/FMN-containing dehydrogenase